MRFRTELRIAIDITKRWRFTKRDVRACTIDDAKLPIMRVYIDLGMHYRKMRRWHRSISWMIEDLIGTHAHEYAHAFIPKGISDPVEEKWALRFERASQWARSQP